MESSLFSTDFSTLEDEAVEKEEYETIHTKNSIFSQLKPLCLNLLEFIQNPNANSSSSYSSLRSLLMFLRSYPSSSLHPFFDYTLFPLLILLDAAVESRSSKKGTVSDKVAEGVVQCLEALLIKCRLQSVDQMVVVMKKLAFAAMLTSSEASEEFREGAIKCFRALLVNLIPCSDDDVCSCQQVSSGFPALSETTGDGLRFSDCDLVQGGGECLLSFLRCQTAAAAIGHWLSLLLKIADAEVVRGHRGNAKIRTEAFMTLRLLVAKVGTADALAFFLPGVVSQFGKVLHVSKTMISGAAGSMEAFDQALRALAEYLMIVLDDGANLSGLDVSLIAMPDFNMNSNQSVHSFLNELRRLPTSSQNHSKIVSKESVEAVKLAAPTSEIMSKASTNLREEKGSLHVDRTRNWIEKTSAHVHRLLTSTFPHICVHPTKRVRQGLLAAVQGLLSKCSYTLNESRLMLLECLFVLIADDSEEVSSPAQEFLEHLFTSSNKHNVQRDIAEIFNRLIEKLPKVVLGHEESIALSHARQLLVVIYYSGPEFVLDHLQSPVLASRFLDVFALCLSQNSAFTGALDKLMLAMPSSVGYLQSITELKASSRLAPGPQNIKDIVQSNVSKLRSIEGKGIRCLSESIQDNYKVPHMPPWFVHVGSQKMYEALAGILRLVGASLMADFKTEGNMSAVIDIPLSFLRKLVSEVRVKEYRKETWQSWYDRTGSGQLLRQASTAACILNEMIFGITDESVGNIVAMFHKSRVRGEHGLESDARVEVPESTESAWKVSNENAARSHLIDCVGRILHEYLCSELWDLPVDFKSSFIRSDAEEISLHFFHDAAALQQVIIDGIGIFALCLGKDFSSSGFLHSSLYLLLENLICSNFQVRAAADAVLHVLSVTSGNPTVGQLVMQNADYVIDSICQQLRHLDINPHVPSVLASMLSYIGVAHKILPLLEEPMCSASQELEILGRHQHPELNIPFLKAVAEIVKASKREASSLPDHAESYLTHVKAKMSEVEKEVRAEYHREPSHHDNDINMLYIASEEWETVLFNLNDAKRYRRTVGSIGGSCLAAATPLLASMKQEECLVALDIVEDGIVTLAKVEEAFRCERKTKEKLEEFIESHSLHQLQDMLDAVEEGADENRLLPAVNKIWPFLVTCVRNKNPVAVRRCFSVIGTVIHISGGDFFSRRFHTDGHHFWRLLSTSPFHRKPLAKEERTTLQLPYRSAPTSSQDSMAEISSLKIQIALLNMIADLCRTKASASALTVVLKKISGIVVGIACSGVAALRDACVNALHGLATIDADLIWLLLADVYYSFKTKGLPSPPAPDLPQMSEILPPPSSPKEYLYVQYGGQSYGFDVDFTSVEIVFNKLRF